MSVLSSLKSFSTDYLTSPGIRIGSKTIKLNFGPLLKGKDDQNALNDKPLRRSHRTRRGAASIAEALNAIPHTPVDPIYRARL